MSGRLYLLTASSKAENRDAVEPSAGVYSGVKLEKMDRFYSGSGFGRLAAIIRLN